MTRIAFIADLHVGHRSGICPPDWWQAKRDRFRRTQEEGWAWYSKKAKETAPDILVVNGDAIEGTGWRSGGTELVIPDMLDQARAARHALRLWRAPLIRMTHGTAYHTSNSDGTDFDRMIAEDLAAEIHDSLKVSVNGLVFDVRHHLGSSSVPHGRHTSISRDRVWDVLKSDRDGVKRADVVVRSHVHYHTYCGGPGWLAVTTPALQAKGSKYGGRKCSGFVDFGFLVFDVEEDGTFEWFTELAHLKEDRQRIENLTARGKRAKIKAAHQKG